MATLEGLRQPKDAQIRALWARQSSLSVSSLPSASQFASEVETFAIEFLLKELYSKINNVLHIKRMSSRVDIVDTDKQNNSITGHFSPWSSSMLK